jgi:hypothetical protein
MKPPTKPRVVGAPIPQRRKPKGNRTDTSKVKLMRGWR